MRAPARAQTARARDGYRSQELSNRVPLFEMKAAKIGSHFDQLRHLQARSVAPVPAPSPQCPLRRPSARSAAPVPATHASVSHAPLLGVARPTVGCCTPPCHVACRRGAYTRTQPSPTRPPACAPRRKITHAAARQTNKQRAESRWGRPEPRRIVKLRLLALPRVVARVLGLPVCGSPCRLRTTATRPRCAGPPPDRSRGKPRGVAAAAWGGRSASRDEPVFPVAGRAAPLVRPRVHRSGRAARRRARRLPRRRERVLSPRPYPCALGTNVPSDGLEYCRQSG